jgi:hypothetical protein
MESLSRVIFIVIILSCRVFAQDESVSEEDLQKKFREFETAKKTVEAVYYFRHTFGHVHQNPSLSSMSMTTISCNHPVKILKVSGAEKKQENLLVNKEWYFVRVANYDGYIHQSALSEKRVECFQDKYPRYFESLNLEVNDLFYWGKLYDHYIHGRSKTK